MRLPSITFGAILAAGSLAISWSEGANAYEVAICDNCSGSQYSQAAVDKGCPNESDVYVVNRPYSMVKAFATVCSYDPGYTIEQATEISGNSAVLNNIDDVLDYYHWAKDVQNVGFGQLPNKPSGVNTAIDLVGNPYRESQVENALATYFTNQYPNPQANEMAEITDSLTTQVKLIFSDGSTYTFNLTSAQFNYSTNDLEITFSKISGSGRESDGTVIPETAQGIGQRAPVDGGLAQEYFAAGNRLGIEYLTDCSTTTRMEGCSTSGSVTTCEYYNTTYCAP